MSKRDEAVLLTILVVVAVVALVLPISAVGLADVARALGVR